jgi:peptide/nickel transport system substrate-binding protein
LAGSFLSWGIVSYYNKTRAIPQFGGEYIEGIVGQPLHINPVISSSNATDEDLVQLIFSGLLKYDSTGNLKNDLTESYEISEDKTLFTFHLRKDAAWHDGQPLTAQDVLFTINLISDPSYKSPLRYNWQGVTTNLVDDYTLTFQIESPYVGFLNNLTFGILPKHIWESVSPDKFTLTDLNLQPIGSGPYKYASFQKDSAGNIIVYKLTANPSYFEKKPFISKLTLNFYPDDDSALTAYNQKEVMGINSLSPQKLDQIELSKSTQIYRLDIPRYFAVFFNQTKSFPLANDEVREALSYATNREEIIENVLDGNGLPVYSPFLPGMIGFDANEKKRDFDLEKAQEILEDNKWLKGDDGIRSKDGHVLEINLITTDWNDLVQTAEILKEQWEKIGARINVNSLSISDIQQNYIRPREYEALLFGQTLGANPDLSSFWHSREKKDPGSNLALFGDDTTDKLIDDGRVEFDNAKRAELYQELQKKIFAEIPAVFLYSPKYIYPVNKKVGGIEIQTLVSPSRRFADIANWYVKTQRVWK